MLKLKATGLAFMKAELDNPNRLQAPIFISEDGDHYLKFIFEEMGISHVGYYRILTPIIHGSVFTMRWYNPPLLSSDVEIVDDFS